MTCGVSAAAVTAGINLLGGVCAPPPGGTEVEEARLAAGWKCHEVGISCVAGTKGLLPNARAPRGVAGDEEAAAACCCGIPPAGTAIVLLVVQDRGVPSWKD